MKEMLANTGIETIPRELVLYGGAFNPPTMGHIACIEALAGTSELPIWVLPSGLRTDKPDMVADEHRLQMLTAAASDRGWNEQILVSDFELRLPRPSNTFDTVQALRAYGAEKIHFVSGLDSVNSVLEWECGDQLLEDLHWVLVRRFGLELEVRPRQFSYVELPDLAISSTDVRTRVASGEQIGHLVTPSVAEYINQMKLYKEQT